MRLERRRLSVRCLNTFPPIRQENIRLYQGRSTHGNMKRYWDGLTASGLKTAGSRTIPVKTTTVLILKGSSPFSLEFTALKWYLKPRLSHWGQNVILSPKRRERLWIT